MEIQNDIYSHGLVSVAKAAAFLGLSRSKIYELMDSGELTYSKFGRARRIPHGALVELARANQQGGPASHSPINGRRPNEKKTW
jgi:excisionase family DNA binding protein